MSFETPVSRVFVSVNSAQAPRHTHQPPARSCLLPSMLPVPGPCRTHTLKLPVPNSGRAAASPLQETVMKEEQLLLALESQVAIRATALQRDSPGLPQVLRMGCHKEPGRAGPRKPPVRRQWRCSQCPVRTSSVFCAVEFLRQGAGYQGTLGLALK